MTLPPEIAGYFEIVARAPEFAYAGIDIQVLPQLAGDPPDLLGRFAALDRLGEEWWLISGVLVTTEYGPALRSLTVDPWPLDDARDIPSAVLRWIKPAELRDRVYVTLVAGGAIPEADAVNLDKATEAKPRRRGRKPHDDSFYRQVALDYLQLQEERGGRSRGLIKALAKRRHVQPETMRVHVKRARDRDFLTRARPGRAGAAPGPRLQQPHEEEETDA